MYGTWGGIVIVSTFDSIHFSQFEGLRNMNLRLWTAAIVFIGSYLPLSLILLAQDFNSADLNLSQCIKFWVDYRQCKFPFMHPYASLSIFFITLFCFISTLAVLWLLPMKHKVTLISAEHVPSELMNYTLPYVVSFMGIGYNDGDKFFGMAIFLLWIFWITHKSGQVILNPVLVAFGWRLHKITYSFEGNADEHQATALLKGDVELNQLAKHNWIQDVMVVRQGKDVEGRK